MADWSHPGLTGRTFSIIYINSILVWRHLPSKAHPREVKWPIFHQVNYFLKSCSQLWGKAACGLTFVIITFKLMVSCSRFTAVTSRGRCWPSSWLPHLHQSAWLEVWSVLDRFGSAVGNWAFSNLGVQGQLVFRFILTLVVVFFSFFFEVSTWRPWKSTVPTWSLCTFLIFGNLSVQVLFPVCIPGFCPCFSSHNSWKT